MYQDKQLTFSQAQSNVRNVGTFVSTNDVDLGVAGDAERQLYLNVCVPTAFVSAVAGGTITISVFTDGDSAFGSPKTLLITDALGVASLTAGAEPIKTRLPSGLERYVRLSYEVKTQNLTVGTITAFLTPVVDTNKP